MRKSLGPNLFFAILWLMFLGLFLFGIGFLAGHEFSSYESTTPKQGSLFSYENNKVDYSSLALLMREVEGLKPNAVAEPLYGPELYRFYIAQINEQYYPDVDPYIALAVLELESNYRPDLKSSAGAVGLMQWIPKWHSWRMAKFHLNDMWDPYTNIIVGMDILNDNYQETGTWNKALYLYNRSTSYVDAVLGRADALREGECFA